MGNKIGRYLSPRKQIGIYPPKNKNNHKYIQQYSMDVITYPCLRPDVGDCASTDASDLKYTHVVVPGMFCNST